MQSKRALLFLCLLVTFPIFAKSEEEKIGEEIAKELIKTYGTVHNPLAQAKLIAIVDYLLQASRHTEIKPKVYILNTPDVNALSLPGGYIFVNNGLLKFVSNDDELAAVLAHELAHTIKKHGLHAGKKGQKVNLQSTLWALALSLATGKGEGVPYLLQAAQLYTQGKMAGYTIQLEQAADRYAVFLLDRSPFSSYALVTFLEKLAYQERMRPSWQLGILKTHPASEERVKNARTLTQKGLKHTLYMEELFFHVKRQKKKIWLYFRKKQLFPILHTSTFKTKEDRAYTYVARANSLALQGAALRNAHLRFKKNYAQLVYGRSEILRFYKDEVGGKKWQGKVRSQWKEVQKIFIEAFFFTLK